MVLTSSLSELMEDQKLQYCLIVPNIKYIYIYIYYIYIYITWQCL